MVVTAGMVVGVSIALRPIDLRPANPAGSAALVGGSGATGEPKPIYRRPWFWVAAGAVVAAGTVTAILLSTRSSGGGSSGVPDTTLGAQRTF